TTANGGISVGTGGYDYLQGRTLNNAGTSTFSTAAYMYLYYGSLINNPSGATWNLTSDYNLYTSTGGGTFNNAGTFEKTGGTTTSEVDPVFNNAGTVQANTATLNFAAPATSSAPWSVGTGATLEFANGTSTSTLSGTISGAGSVQFSGGTLNL